MALKKRINQKIHHNFIQHAKNNHGYKMRTVVVLLYEKKAYIEEGKLNNEKTKEALYIRLHMKNYAANYGGKDKMC